MSRSGETKRPPYLEAIQRRGREANPFFMLMGVEVVHIGNGQATLQMPVRPDMHNGAGWLQGGLYVSLADEAMALALYTILGETERIATVSEATSFMKGVREGTVVATGRVVKKGGRVAFTEGEVREAAPEGELLTQTTAAFALIR
jgi:acyl-CoA thioesterase